MPARPRQQPFHEPIGFSPEAFSTSHRWFVLTVAVVVVVVVVGVVSLLRLTGRL